MHISNILASWKISGVYIAHFDEQLLTISIIKFRNVMLEEWRKVPLFQWKSMNFAIGQNWDRTLVILRLTHTNYVYWVLKGNKKWFRWDFQDNLIKGSMGSPLLKKMNREYLGTQGLKSRYKKLLLTLWMQKWRSYFFSVKGHLDIYNIIHRL